MKTKGNNRLIKELRTQINAKKKELKKAQTAEKEVIKKWKGWFAKQMKAAQNLAKIRIHGTAKEDRLRTLIIEGIGKSPQMTAERDARRKESDKIQAEIQTLSLEVARLTGEQNSRVAENDEIVQQLFGLNKTVVEASLRREECLNRYVFPRLVVDGKLNTQITFYSADGLRKVVALVNRMTFVQGDLAQEAQTLIAQFFARFTKTTMSPEANALFELTKKILTERTTFKVSYDFYRFISMELNPCVFGELYRAQQLLRNSIRSEKTDKYVRLSERDSREGKWRQVRQS